MDKKKLALLALYTYGIGVGVLTARLYYRNKFERLYQEEKASLNKMMKEKAYRVNQEQNDISEEPLDVELVEEKTEVVVDDPRDPSQMMAYNKIVTTQNYSRENESQPKTEEPVHIYEIDFEKFNEPPDEDGFEYEKTSLTYYAEDGVLTDEHDEIIEDIAERLGDDDVERLFDKAPTTEIYIRNDNREEDFEVMMLEASYQTVVLGEGD